jgi:hypothetical protein
LCPRLSDDQRPLERSVSHPADALIILWFASGWEICGDWEREYSNWQTPWNNPSQQELRFRIPVRDYVRIQKWKIAAIGLGWIKQICLETTCINFELHGRTRLQRKSEGDWVKTLWPPVTDLKRFHSAESRAGQQQTEQWRRMLTHARDWHCLRLYS